MTLFRNFAVLRQHYGYPFAPIQILTGDTREGCAFRYRWLHDERRSFRIKLRIERRFESFPGVQRVATLDLLETWSSCSRPFAILPVSAVSDAQKLATGNFLHVRACFCGTFCTPQKVPKKRSLAGSFEVLRTSIQLAAIAASHKQN